MTNKNPFRYFKTSPEIIRLAVMLYVRFPLSLRNVEDLLHERGVDVSHETIRHWWNRFGPIRVRAVADPQTQGKIERWHQTLKNRVLLENYYLPGDLEAQNGTFIEH